MKEKKNFSHRDKVICAGISVTLMFAAFTFAFWQTDQRFAAAGLFAGLFYMLTTFAFVFENGVGTGEEEK